jgi:hypothetical protein
MISIAHWVRAATERLSHGARSLSDLGNRSEHGERARTEDHALEAHSGPTVPVRIEAEAVAFDAIPWAQANGLAVVRL